MREVRDTAQVPRDIFADLSVTTGGSLNKPAFLIPQARGKAIDLRFGKKGDFLCRPQPKKPPDTPFELTKFIVTEGVVERQHVHLVPDFAKSFGGGDAKALRRAIGCHQFRELSLQSKKLFSQFIIFRVGYNGSIFRIIGGVMFLDGVGERFMSFLRFFGRHVLQVRH